MTMASIHNIDSPSPKRRRRLVGCSFYGPPPTELSDVETLRFVLRRFKTLPQRNGEELETEVLVAHNHSWFLEVYPRGYENDDACAWVLVYLFCLDSSQSNKVEAKFKMRFGQKKTRTREYTFDGPDGSYSTRVEARRDKILDDCLDAEGSLVIEVDIQVYVEKKPVWYPKPSQEKHPAPGRYLLQSSVGADVSFAVVGVDDQIEKFHAHKCILFHRAPGLYEFVKDAPQGEDFVINDIPVPIFKALLEYIYAGTLPVVTKDDKLDAKELLSAVANRFGCTYLKLHTESEIVTKLLNVDNAANWLMIADSHSCALLKEACMKIYSDNPSKVMSSSGWVKVGESTTLLQELLKLSFSKSNADAGLEDEYDDMSVRALRENLESHNLDLDGTKEMLIQRLRDYRRENFSVPTTIETRRPLNEEQNVT